MKVLVISTGSFGMDGISNVILNYYRSIDKSDIHFDFLFPNKLQKNIQAEFEANDSKVFQIEGRMRNPWLYVRKLITLLNEHDFDIVHAHGNSCTLALETYAAKKAGIKVRIPHSHNSTNNYKLAHKAFRKLFDSTYTHGFACGQLAGEWLYNGRPFEIINNAIEVERFEFNSTIREEIRKEFGFESYKVVGHIGHFTYQKNQQFLVNVFHELHELDPNYRLLLIGDGDLKADTEKAVRNTDLSDVVIFTGNSLKVPSLLQAMDLLVLPSRFEGLPLTLIEAQTASLPCFASDAVTRDAGIAGLTKFISLQKTPKQWAAIIHGEQSVNRLQMSKRMNQEIAEAGFSISDNAHKVSTLYKEYLQQATE